MADMDLQETGPIPEDKQLREIIESVPESERDKVIQAIMVVRESFSGPIPHPSILKGYEQIVPGSADRIITMAETQQEHRMELEKMAVSGQLSSNKRGQIFAFIVFFVCIGVGVLLAFLGMKTFAGTLITVTVVSLAGLFLTGRAGISSDLEKKKKDKPE